VSVLGAALRETLRDATEEKLLTPITRSVLLDPKFKGFDVPVEGWTPRPYDGKFHPSTHATWTARQLYLYLTEPTLVGVEQMTMTSVLAITQGKFFHEFLQRLWLAHGILQRAECPLRDPEHNRVGHMDGFLATNEGLEIKSMNDYTLPKVFDALTLREKKPDYYAQTQDYLDMGGLTQMRYFIISTSYPYNMQEFVVPFDEPFQLAQRRKYREAIEAAESGQPPQFCCPLRSAEARGCPVKNGCEIGRAS
jgi:hypothetical protein